MHAARHLDEIVLDAYDGDARTDGVPEILAP